MAGVVHHMQHAAFDGLVIGIGEDKVRAFAAKLQMDLLQRIRRVLGNRDAGAGGAGEAHHIHILMAGQGGAHGRAVAVHKVEDTGGEACLIHHLGKDHRAQRAFLRRFQHHGAARGNSGADFQHHLVHRPVPRRDHRHDANRFVNDPVVRRVITQWLYEFEIFRRFDEVLQVGVTRPPLGTARHLDGCAHLGADRLGHILGPGFIDLGQFLHQRDALFGGGGHPRGQGGLGRGHGSVHVLWPAERDHGAGFFGRGVDDLMFTALKRGDPFAVDIEITFFDHALSPLLARRASFLPPRSVRESPAPDMPRTILRGGKVQR